MTKRIIDGKLECSMCHEWKPLDGFYKNKISYHGVEGRCKVCNLKRQNERHTNNLDRALKDIVNRHKTNTRNGSQRRKGFDGGCITFEFLRGLWGAQGGRCAVTGKIMTHVQGKGLCLDTNVSIDRIEPEVGYIPGNVRLVCKAVNYLKWTMTDKEMVGWAKAIVDSPVAQRLSDVVSQSPQKVQN